MRWCRCAHGSCRARSATRRTAGEADARGYFVEQEQARLRGEELHFAFVEPADDHVVLGGGSLYDIDFEQSRAAVGYWLAPP